MVRSFRSKLFVIVTVMTVFPLLLLLATGYTSLHRVLMRSTVHNMKALARLQVAQFRAYLQEKRTMSRTLWESDHVKIQQLQKLRAAETPEQEKQKIQQDLRQQWQQKLEQGKLVGMGIWDERGTSLFSIGSSLQRHPLHVASIKPTVGSQVLGIYHFSKAAETVLRMVTSVSAGQGKRWWLVTDFPFTLHQRFLQEKQAPAFQAMIYVLDQKHRVVCGSFDISHEHHHFGTSRPIPFWTTQQQLGQVHRYVNAEGVEVLGMALPMRGVSWLLLVELPEKQALGVLQTLGTQGLIWAAGFLGAWLFAAARLSRYIVSQQERWMAMAIHREKMAATGLLASGVAHEIGNPLASIFAGIQRLQRKVQDTEVRESLQGLRERCETIMRILDTLRNYVRKKEEHTTPINTNREIQKALDIVKFDQRLRHIAVETSLSPDLPLFWAREDALLQVVANLLLNAVDAVATQDNPWIQVQTWPTQTGIGISVCDNGIGVDEAWKEKIFEPFISTKGEQKGMGLGLSICKNIVESLGGSISVSAHPPKGTCFTVYLPATIQETKDSPQAAAHPQIRKNQAGSVVHGEEKIP